MGFHPRVSGGPRGTGAAAGLPVGAGGVRASRRSQSLVADFFRAWYRRRRLLAERLVVANFILMEPYWTLRTGSVPFWTVFDVEPSAARLESYLAGTDAYDEIYLWRFPHGVRSAGRASVERWRSVLARARKRGGFLGQDLGRYPGILPPWCVTMGAFQRPRRPVIRYRGR